MDRAVTTPGVTRVRGSSEGIDNRGILSSSVSGLTLVIDSEATFLEGDELLEGRQVLATRFVTHVMVGDVDRGESLGYFAHMVSHPSESAGKVFDVGAKEYSDGVTIAARVEDAFIAIGEAGIHFVDSAIGKSAELEGASSGAFTEELLESEGALW